MIEENGKGKMMNEIDIDERLQQKLAQIEMGYPLEGCLDGMDAAEAELLQFAANLRETPFPDEDEAVVARQRTRLLMAASTLVSQIGVQAETNKNGTAVSQTTIPILDWLRAQMDNLLQRRELAIGLASLLVIFLLLAGVGLSRWQADRQGVQVEGESQPAQSEVAADLPGGTESESDGPVGAAPDAQEGSPPVTDAPGAAETSGHQLYLPMAGSPLETNPQTAVLEVRHGLVEAETGGQWTVVNRVSTLSAGQRVRTGPLSLATLTFFDGSQAVLSANSELSIDQLDARLPDDGWRTVVLTQHLGESEHSVDFRNDGGSRYEVNTAAGSAVARGTRFNVSVTPNLLAHIAVSEGRVDVSGLNQVVSVVAGQTTAVLAGSPPETPAFRITGEGEVGQIGTVWTIAGQTFETTERTVVVGQPQVGDLVRVEGRLLADGRRLADRITLLRRAVTNRFTLTGEVESMSGTAWTVAGQTILVNADTRIDDDVNVGDRVQVSGAILMGGTLQARRIERLADATGLPFRFTGLVEAVGDNNWTISGVVVGVNVDTTIEPALIVGDLVEVNGRILDDGTWLARRIVRSTESLPEFSFTGRVQSIDPWQVAGIAFETRDWTAIEPGIGIGDRVRVRGVLLSDGTWVASRIDRLSRDDDDDDDDRYNTIVLVGVVSSINPWVVNGMQLFLTDDSRIVGDIRVGDLVTVRLRLSPDGTWRVVVIRPFTPRFGLGCLIINTTLLGVESNQLLLQHWSALSLDDGNDLQRLRGVERNSVVTVPLCFAFDGRIIIIGPVIVIYQPIVIILPPQPPRGNQNFNFNQNFNRNFNFNG